MDFKAPSVLTAETSVLDQFREDVISGLSLQPKSLPCKYFYDERGCGLFEDICQLDEYYLTRAELAIMHASAHEMAAEIGPRALIAELGSGSSVKTRRLLDYLDKPVAYVPIDIGGEHLEQTVEALAAEYSHIEILPVHSDFTSEFELPRPSDDQGRTVFYFPGSTIGNFEPDDAILLLRRIAAMIGAGGGLLIGIDVKKDAQKIEAAYNDAEGVTAQFNLNLLQRINDELGADFQLDHFRHRAVYNDQLGRVELGLISKQRQTVLIDDEPFHFEPGEEIRTEYSHKYSVGDFRELASAADFTLSRQWKDKDALFAVLYFTLES